MLTEYFVKSTEAGLAGAAELLVVALWRYTGLISGTLVLSYLHSQFSVIYVLQFANTQGTSSGCVLTICFDSDNHSRTGWSKLHNSTAACSVYPSAL